MIWELFWKIILISTICSYAVLVIVVVIGGVGNIADMLRDLAAGGDSSQSPSQ